MGRRMESIENVRCRAATRVELMARILFKNDTYDRDFKEYGEFEKMPPGLQEWWRDRAARRIRDIDHWKWLAGERTK